MQVWLRQQHRRMGRDRRTPLLWRPEEAEEYGQWLGRFPWDWFTTHTFPDEIGVDQAKRLHKRWTRALELVTGRDLRQVRGLEYQKRGVIHFHALVWGVHSHTRRFTWMKIWEEIAGGFARVHAFDPELGAAHYVAKYISKGGEIDLLGPWWPPRGRADDPRRRSEEGEPDAEPERQ